MEDLVKANPEVRVIHHTEREGIGSGFWEGIMHARFYYIASFPRDRAYNIEGLKSVFKSVGTAEFIIICRAHQMQARSLLRLVLSRLF